MPREGAVLDPKNLPSNLDPNQHDLLVNVDIYVYRVPEFFKGGNSEQDLLIDLGYIDRESLTETKEIEFNGKPALLLEKDFDSTTDEKGQVVTPKMSTCIISISMTPDTVVLIDVTTLPDSGLRAWDVIEKFTISKK